MSCRFWWTCSGILVFPCALDRDRRSVFTKLVLMVEYSAIDYSMMKVLLRESVIDYLSLATFVFSVSN